MPHPTPFPPPLPGHFLPEGKVSPLEKPSYRGQLLTSGNIAPGLNSILLFGCDLTSRGYIAM